MDFKWGGDEMTNFEEKEIGCWNCALEGVKSGKPCCPDCGTEVAHYCGAYSHDKVLVEKSDNVRDAKRK